jgi:hypothetical protein
MHVIVDEVDAPISQFLWPIRCSPLISKNAIRSARRTGIPIDDPPYYTIKSRTFRAMPSLENAYSTTQFDMGFEMMIKNTHA